MSDEHSEVALERLLALRPACGVDRHRVDLSGFGAETLGCAVRAAALSCPDKRLHSLHAYYLRPVAGEGLELAIDRLRDGRRFALRRARIETGGKTGFEALVSFAAPAPGETFQDAEIPDAFARPEDWPIEDDLAKERELEPPRGPLAFRWCGVPWELAGRRAEYHCWVRPRVPLPADAALRAGAVAYLADYHSHFPVARKLGGLFDSVEYTSLDQSVWLHRDEPWTDWWYLHSECDGGAGGRALSRRRLFTREGALVATMVQEALIPAPRNESAPA